MKISIEPVSDRPWFKRVKFRFNREFQEEIKRYPGVRGEGPPGWTWLVPIELLEEIEQLAEEY